MSGYMFHDEMVKRMMKSTVNPDAQILETAYETGRKQGEAETVKAVLEIVDEIERDTEHVALIGDDNKFAGVLCNSSEFRDRVLALKGEQE